MNKISLEEIKPKDLYRIYEITSNPEVMKYVGNGKQWTKENVYNFIKYNLIEKKQNNSKRTHYSYKIVYNNDLAGIIEFHQFNELKNKNYHNKYFITRFIDIKYQRKGLGYLSMQLIKKEFYIHKSQSDKLYSLVRKSNEPMKKFMNKYNYQIKDEVIFNNEIFLIYEINIVNTYLFTVNKNIPNELINSLLQKRKNWNKTEVFPNDFLLFLNYYDFNKNNRKHFYKKSNMKSLVNNENNYLISKDKVFNSLKNLNSKYKLDEIKLDSKNINKYKNSIQDLFDKYNLLIIKKVKSYAGRDIYFSNSFSNLVNQIINEKGTFVIQEYIKNPYLINNKKFHFRVNILVTFFNKIIKLYFNKDILMGFAQKEFILNKLNKNIHNSHFRNKEINIFPEYFIENNLLTNENINYIYKQLYDILKSIKNNIDISCYSDSNFCFELYGLDLMITEDLNLKLIEFNFNPGMKMKNYNQFFEGLLEKTIDEIYPPYSNIEKVNSFIEIN